MLALPKTNLDSYIKYFFGILIIILLTSCSEEKVVGFLEGVGEVTEKQIPEEIIKERSEIQKIASLKRVNRSKEILFGDLHVHSTFSTDANLWSLPIQYGRNEGAHPVGDACDYARFCSSVDFWSINDHAEATTPRKWKSTKESIRACNAVSLDKKNQDMVTFLGWEWTQAAVNRNEHYGHKNIILLEEDDDKVPLRPIASTGTGSDFIRGRVPLFDISEGVADLISSKEDKQRLANFAVFNQEYKPIPDCSGDESLWDEFCYEDASTPSELFLKLEKLNVEHLVIPHGNAWGIYTPTGQSWDKQLSEVNPQENRELLIEVMSGHGNSEEYRDFRAVIINSDGNITCPESSKDYQPTCRKAAEITYKRCLKEGNDSNVCDKKSKEIMQTFAEASVNDRQQIVSDTTMEEWLNAGQCTDCFLPAYNYRPKGSVQYSLAKTNFDNPNQPKNYRWGFIASSDVHSSRPGTGYKEVYRLKNTDGNGPSKPEVAYALPGLSRNPDLQRFSSFLTTGGLAAVHSSGRSKEEIWSALNKKETYGTSGDRILLWFDLLNSAKGELPMGSEGSVDVAPTFEVSAIGAFIQKPGCPEFSVNSLSPERLDKLCGGECYNPSDERKIISRIEVIRILPQISEGEDINNLIQDPWKVMNCPKNQDGCTVQFDDPEFINLNRTAIYYVRAIQEPSLAINAENLRCEFDEKGECIKVNPCYGDYRTSQDDECLAPNEERAWSSPIFVNKISKTANSSGK
tara:strand:- start:15369 stop:17600 length:2232 start_codon:yes stop_codon:yes gene_type:complete